MKKRLEVKFKMYCYCYILTRNVQIDKNVYTLKTNYQYQNKLSYNNHTLSTSFLDLFRDKFELHVIIRGIQLHKTTLY